jgi:hypothetical protein
MLIRLLSLFLGQVQPRKSRQHDHPVDCSVGSDGQGHQHIRDESERVVLLALPRAKGHCQG